MVTTNGLTDTYYGLSTDTKPTGKQIQNEHRNGSKFIEIDTGKTYLYDEENAEWLEQASSGGGGGSSDFGTATITVTETGDTNGYIYAPIWLKIDEDDIDVTLGYIETVPQETESYTIILSGGLSEIYMPEDQMIVISTSGDIEDCGDGHYGITGDCSITVESSSNGVTGGVYYGKAYSGNGIVFDIASGNPLPENITMMYAVYPANFTVESGAWVSQMQMFYDTYYDNWDSYVTYIEMSNNKPSQRKVFRDLVIDFDTEGEISITNPDSEVVNHDNYNSWMLFVF